MKKTLIMVCENCDRKYATYIQQLISAYDDTESENVGTVDGKVDAVVWDEKHYQDNLGKLNTSNHILFIGDCDIAKEARCNMDIKFSELGMMYGWLGTQAFMRVEDGALNKENYAKFKELCHSYGKKFEKELDLRYGPSSNVEKKDKETDSINKKEDKRPEMPAFLSLIVGAANTVVNQGKNIIDNVT